MDWSKISNGFNKLTTAITPFITNVKEAEASLTALYGILNKGSGKKIGGLLDGSTKSTKSSKNVLSGILRLGSWTAVLYTARRLGRVVADIATAGSDFGETLNLWKVAMGNEFLPQATEFVNKLNEAYGISKETLMNSQAIFKNMLGSLGEISYAQAYSLSEGITQMALDYASLYNVQFEDAMTKFQAALAGQVRPIRSVSGYDITENTLFQLYQELGGTKTMSQLSRTEKQLLAIYAVFEQMGRSGATGDLERTINSFANQSRVMAESWKDVQTYAGLTVTRLLESTGLLKYVNAVLIFISRILEGLATSLDTGLDTEFADPFEEIEEGANDTSNAIDGTTEAVEDLQNALLDFDKFRALDSKASKNTVSDNLELDKNILDAMKEYDGILEEAGLEARKLADSWLESLGFVDENNDGIIDMQDGIGALKELISSINWGDVGNQASSALSTALDTLTGWISDQDWEKAGQDIADFIKEFKWGELIIDALELGAALAGGLTTALYEALMSLFKPILDFIEELFRALHFDQMHQDLFGESVEESASKVRGFATNLHEGLLQMAQDISKWWESLWAKPPKDITQVRFASGGLPDKGSMFIAGEAGAEYVYNMPSGQSGVANVQQIAQATYNGTIKALNDWWGGSSAKTDIPQLESANSTGLYQAVTGVALQYGKTWSKV